MVIIQSDSSIVLSSMGLFPLHVDFHVLFVTLSILIIDVSIVFFAVNEELFIYSIQLSTAAAGKSAAARIALYAIFSIRCLIFSSARLSISLH